MALLHRLWDRQSLSCQVLQVDLGECQFQSCESDDGAINDVEEYLSLPRHPSCELRPEIEPS